MRLHFAETTFDHAGGRRFNAAINGAPVLINYDIFAEAGGKDKAVVKNFPGIMPDTSGHIIIALTPGTADQPAISGIQILPE